MVKKKIAMTVKLKVGTDLAGLLCLMDRSQQRSAIGGSSRAGYMER